MSHTGMIVAPNAIRTYGTAVGRQEAALARINAALAGVHLDANAFGKLPEAGDLWNAYTTHAQDVRAITAKLPQQIASVAQGLDGTASSYADLEAYMADGIQQLFGTPARAGSTSLAGDALGAFAGIAAATRSAYKWVNEPETSLPALAAGLDGASGGLSGLLDEAINWVIEHVPELPKLLDDVTGDYEALQAAAKVWHEQGEAMNAVVHDLKASAGNLPQEWAGQASQSFGSFMADVVRSLETMSAVMGQTQQILEDAAKESKFAHDFIVMIIREVVEWVAGNLLADALTLGLATIAEAPATSAFLASRVAAAEQSASKLADFYRALQKIVESLKELKEGVETAKGLDKLEKFVSLARDFTKVLEIGKLRNLRLFGDGKLAEAAKVLWGGGEHAAGAPEVLAAGSGGVLADASVRAGLSGVMGLTGLPAAPGAAGLASGVLTGGLSEISGNPQGAAEAFGLGTPPIPPAPPVSKVKAMLANEPPAPKEK